MAATVLFVASVSGFAQSESAKSPSEVSGVEVVAVNKTPRTIDLFSTKSAATVKKAAAKKDNGFSAAKFMEAARESVASTPVTPEYRFDSNVKSADFDNSTTSKSVVFVPSRGPKYPFQVM
jgi:hypothetical protein